MFENNKATKACRANKASKAIRLTGLLKTKKVHWIIFLFSFLFITRYIILRG